MMIQGSDNSGLRSYLPGRWGIIYGHLWESIEVCKGASHHITPSIVSYLLVACMYECMYACMYVVTTRLRTDHNP
jgi:hypothetical protein